MELPYVDLFGSESIVAFSNSDEFDRFVYWGTIWASLRRLIYRIKEVTLNASSRPASTLPI